MLTTVEGRVTIPLQYEFFQLWNVLFYWRKWNVIWRIWSLNSLGTVAAVWLVETVEVVSRLDLREVLVDDTKVTAGSFGELC